MMATADDSPVLKRNHGKVDCHILTWTDGEPTHASYFWQVFVEEEAHTGASRSQNLMTIPQTVGGYWKEKSQSWYRESSDYCVRQTLHRACSAATRDKLSSRLSSILTFL